MLAPDDLLRLFTSMDSVSIVSGSPMDCSAASALIRFYFGANMPIYSDLYVCWMNSAVSEREGKLQELVVEMKKDDARMQAWQSSPGGIIMMNYMQYKHISELFAGFMTYARDHASGDKPWLWIPSVCGAKAGQLLDGTVNMGECAMFATNFMVLAWAPPPFGLGIPRGKLQVFRDTGLYGNGMITKHGQATMISRLAPNVQPPKDSLPSSEFYVWPNHQYVVYDGRIYDPCYGTNYERMSEHIGDYQLAPADMKIPGCQKEGEYVVAGSKKYLVALATRVFFVKERKNKSSAAPYRGPLDTIAI